MSDTEENETSTPEEPKDYTFGADKTHPGNSNVPVAKLDNSVPKSSDKPDRPKDKS